MLRYEHRVCFDIIFNISAYCRLEEGYIHYLLSKAGDVKINEGPEAGYESQKWLLEEERSSLALVSRSSYAMIRSGSFTCIHSVAYASHIEVG